MATTSQAINIQHLAARVAALEEQIAQAQIVEFYFTAADTVTLPKGWAIISVDLKTSGAQEVGSSYEYTKSFDGFAWSVNFNVTPSYRVRVLARRV